MADRSHGGEPDGPEGVGIPPDVRHARAGRVRAYILGSWAVLEDLAAAVEEIAAFSAQGPLRGRDAERIAVLGARVGRDGMKAGRGLKKAARELLREEGNPPPCV